MQTDLFGNSKPSVDELIKENVSKVSGLSVFLDFIGRDEEAILLSKIDNSDWLLDLSRRVQHYGYKYDYKARKIDESFYLGKLPDWLESLAQKISTQNLIDFKPDQAIINEYGIGQGIAPHIDCVPCFGDTILSLSLGSSCVINFERKPHSKEKVEILVPPRSLLIMKKESRFDWYHGIPPRKSDSFNGELKKRTRRVSITFRKVVLDKSGK